MPLYSISITFSSCCSYTVQILRHHPDRHKSSSNSLSSTSRRKERSNGLCPNQCRRCTLPNSSLCWSQVSVLTCPGSQLGPSRFNLAHDFRSSMLCCRNDARIDTPLRPRSSRRHLPCIPPSIRR